MTQTAIAEVTPIFSGKSARAPRRRDDRKSKVELHPDSELIAHCIDVAKYTASARAAFKADPTGDSDFAGINDDVDRRRTQRSLDAATAVSATTMDGLRAKASLVSIMIDDLDGSPLEDYHEAFLRAFAADVVRFQQISPLPTDIAFKKQEQADEHHSRARAQ